MIDKNKNKNKNKNKIHPLLAQIDCCEYVSEQEKVIEDWIEQNQPSPVVVGLSEDQMIDLWSWLDHMEEEHHFKSKLQVMKEWQSKQTFTQPEVKEVVVGLSDEQVGELAYLMWQRNCADTIRGYLKNQTFVHPTEVSADTYNQLVSDYEELQKSKQPTPSWESAPEWANWLAQDEDGRLSFYENKPITHKNIYDNRGVGYWEYSGKSKLLETTVNWKEALQERPQPTPKVEVGQVWKHQNTCKYQITSVGEVKINGDWIDCVTYHSLELKSDRDYTRTLTDFIAKFEQVQS